jgi:hypothetical protein
MFSTAKCCAPDPQAKRPRSVRVILIVVLYVVGLAYVPALLWIGTAPGVIAAIAPPALALTAEMTRRLARRPRPAGGSRPAQA